MSKKITRFEHDHTEKTVEKTYFSKQTIFFKKLQCNVPRKQFWKKKIRNIYSFIINPTRMGLSLIKIYELRRFSRFTQCKNPIFPCLWNIGNLNKKFFLYNQFFISKKFLNDIGFCINPFLFWKTRKILSLGWLD